ncbi:FxLYD domain-containing protein [Streptomyces camelliae]|uniref:FxLYD domain-containing protein n=1 Tax=Streptomyces camelliae TaxID=3004093 RepID=A0ABY7PDK2_9ACTN|nr:FxLYD domain-containing protein [Streptomyces sp. HUAS 2-6]WBO68693.1 FxLYD domain-containing protein [Streptomyces sp. HUAS 2-6]
MAEHVGRRATVAVLAALLAVSAGGCSGGGGSASNAASKAASAAESAGSRAAAALASATAEARRRLDAVKGGVDARGDVRLGATGTDGSGRSTVTVTAHNTTAAKKSFAVQVDFRDAGGNLLDVVVVTVPDVAAGTSGTATARSTHKLSGTAKAEAGTAVRY